MNGGLLVLPLMLRGICGALMLLMVVLNKERRGQRRRTVRDWKLATTSEMSLTGGDYLLLSAIIQKVNLCQHPDSLSSCHPPPLMSCICSLKLIQHTARNSVDCSGHRDFMLIFCIQTVDLSKQGKSLGPEYRIQNLDRKG